MNRTLWNKRYFSKDNPISYPCPKCFDGILKLIHIRQEITESGRELQAYNYPYGIDHVFSGIYKCNDVSCNAVMAVVGTLQKDVEIPLYNDTMDIDYADFYTPLFFYPNLRLFKLSDQITKEIIDQIDLSFSLFFSDLSSCANKIRITIEMILDDIKAPKYKIMGSKKRHVFNLHGRILHYKKKNKALAELMLAIKFIGNEGSHKGALELNDVLDAYEILYQIVDTAYVKQRLKALNLAREINSQGKPRSKH